MTILKALKGELSSFKAKVVQITNEFVILMDDTGKAKALISDVKNLPGRIINIISFYRSGDVLVIEEYIIENDNQFTVEYALNSTNW